MIENQIVFQEHMLKAAIVRDDLLHRIVSKCLGRDWYFSSELKLFEIIKADKYPDRDYIAYKHNIIGYIEMTSEYTESVKDCITVSCVMRESFHPCSKIE